MKLTNEFTRVRLLSRVSKTDPRSKKRSFGERKRAAIPPPLPRQPPPLVQPNTPKLDKSQGVNGVIQQYLAALRRLLDRGGTNWQQVIDKTAKDLTFSYGKAAGDFFRQRAQYVVENMHQFKQAVQH